MKVYVVYAGRYEEEGIAGIYSTRDLAMAEAERVAATQTKWRTPDTPSSFIAEYDLDPPYPQNEEAPEQPPV